MNQKLPVDGFKGQKTLALLKILLKYTIKSIVLDEFLKLKWIFLNNWECHIMICLFYIKKWKFITKMAYLYFKWEIQICCTYKK